MSDSNYTPGQVEKLAELCEWCAASVPARKDERGNYIHFKEGLKCEADKLRKLFDPVDVEKQAWDSFMSEQCPMCKTHKKKAQSFCFDCYKALPRNVQLGLYKRFKAGYVAVWIQACAILRQQRTEEKSA